jgi:hypothetical protein
MKTDAAMAMNATQKLKLESSASYLLVGDLGGLGRVVARHPVD